MRRVLIPVVISLLAASACGDAVDTTAEDQGASAEDRYVAALAELGLLGEFASEESAIAAGTAVCEALEAGGPVEGSTVDRIAVEFLCDRYLDEFVVLTTDDVYLRALAEAGLGDEFSDEAEALRFAELVCDGLDEDEPARGTEAEGIAQEYFCYDYPDALEPHLRVHPWVKRHYVTTISVEDILESVNSGQAFVLELGGEPHAISVSPVPVSHPDAVILVVGEDGEAERYYSTDLITYAGSVGGAEETSSVRLTITPNMLGGYVMEGDDWWFIEPLVKFDAEAESTDYLVYRTDDLEFELDYGNDLVHSTMDQFDPDSLPPGSGYIGEPPPPPPDPTSHKVGPDIRIAMVADKEYNEERAWSEDPWYMHQLKVLNEVNGLYWRNIRYRFLARVFILDPQTLVSTNGEVLLHQLKTSVRTRWADLGRVVERINFETEVAHLTSGKDLDGDLLGKAEFWYRVKDGVYQGLGGVHSLSQQYVGNTIYGGLDPPNLAYRNLMVMAHELGHSFNAIHEQSVKWCVTYFGFCMDWERSLMSAKYYDDNLDWISDGQYQEGHNNRQRIVNNATYFRTADLIETAGTL